MRVGFQDVFLPDCINFVLRFCQMYLKIGYNLNHAPQKFEHL